MGRTFFAARPLLRLSSGADRVKLGDVFVLFDVLPSIENFRGLRMNLGVTDKDQSEQVIGGHGALRHALQLTGTRLFAGFVRTES